MNFHNSMLSNFIMSKFFIICFLQKFISEMVWSFSFHNIFINCLIVYWAINWCFLIFFIIWIPDLLLILIKDKWLFIFLKYRVFWLIWNDTQIQICQLLINFFNNLNNWFSFIFIFNFIVAYNFHVTCFP